MVTTSHNGFTCHVGNFVSSDDVGSVALGCRYLMQNIDLNQESVASHHCLFS
jgi:hypothetical protein